MRQRGFSMTELVLVIIVTGILAVVVVPVFNDAGEFRARGYSDEVLSAARYAQKLAVGRGCGVQLTLSSTAGYSLHTESVCASGDFNTKLQLPGRSSDDSPPDNAGLSDTIMVFNANGSRGGGAGFNVGGRSFVVHAATGYVEETTP